MKKTNLIFIFGIVFLMLPFAYAEQCAYSENLLQNMNGANVSESGPAKTLFGKSAGIKLSVTDEQKDYYFQITDYVVAYKGNESIDNVGFTVTTDSCTLQRIDQGGDVMKEYQDGNIKVKAVGFGKKTKLLFGRIGFWFYSIFS